MEKKMIKFLCSNEDTNDFQSKKAKVILDDKNLFEVSFESFDITSNDVISHYQLLKIEDGLYQLVFYYQENIVTCVIDIGKKVVNMLLLNQKKKATMIRKKGSFEWIDEAGNVDVTSCFTNAEKAVDFWVRFFNQHDESAIDDYLAEPYLQHNPTVADGIEAFRNEFHPRFKSDMKACTTIVKKVVARDDLVFIHNILKRSPAVKGHAAVDIFRFENGKIVEHWDVIQKIPEQAKNDHPMF